jgi:hypothetical protein
LKLEAKFGSDLIESEEIGSRNRKLLFSHFKMDNLSNVYSVSEIKVRSFNL